MKTVIFVIVLISLIMKSQPFPQGLEVRKSLPMIIHDFELRPDVEVVEGEIKIIVKNTTQILHMSVWLEPAQEDEIEGLNLKNLADMVVSQATYPNSNVKTRESNQNEYQETLPNTYSYEEETTSSPHKADIPQFTRQNTKTYAKQIRDKIMELEGQIGGTITGNFSREFTFYEGNHEMKLVCNYTTSPYDTDVKVKCKIVKIVERSMMFQEMEQIVHRQPSRNLNDWKLAFSAKFIAESSEEDYDENLGSYFVDFANDGKPSKTQNATTHLLNKLRDGQY